MSVSVLIPARYASTRYPGKPLAVLRGAGGQAKTLIQRSWEAACQVSGVDSIHVVTDDDRIAEAARAFGADVLMTSPECANGTERCAEAVQHFATPPEIVVNLQGDAPLTPPGFVEALIKAQQDQPSRPVVTPVLRCDEYALKGFLDDRAAGRVGGTTAVFDRTGRALYFSKEVIPYTGGKLTDNGICPVFHHVGVYGYRAAPLARYAAMPQGPLERLEGLEQLRFMENGVDVHCVEVSAPGAKFWELNNPEDVPRIEAVLAEQGVA